MFTGKAVIGEISLEMAKYLAEHSVDGTVHSVFSKAINIVSGETMVSVLSKETLLEPMSVRLDDAISFTAAGIKAGDSVHLSPDSLTVGMLRMPWKLVDSWKEKHTFELNSLQECAYRADRFLTDYLQTFVRPVGMAVLFQKTDDEGKRGYLSGKVQMLMSAQTEEETLAAMSELVGLGPGLTPAGDDFLCGYMRTSILLGTKIDYAKLIKRIKHLTNELSAKSLELASEGRCAEEISLILFELFDARGSYVKAISHINAVASYGSSSGTDIICGICMAIKKELAKNTIQFKSI